MGNWFVLVTVPEKRWSGKHGSSVRPEARSLIGPFSTLDGAQRWRDERITADGATSEILTPEQPR